MKPNQLAAEAAEKALEHLTDAGFDLSEEDIEAFMDAVGGRTERFIEEDILGIEPDDSAEEKKRKLQEGMPPSPALGL